MRQKSKNRELAFKEYADSGGKETPKQIANKLNEKVTNIRSWKCQDRWDEKLGIVKHRKPGGQKGNKNAAGNKGGGAPEGNLNSLKHGIYADDTKRLPNEFVKKWFPIGMKNAYEQSKDLEISKLEQLGHAIDMLWAKILVSQKIIQVKNKKDLTKVLKKQQWGKTDMEEYELQFAWDKENSALDVSSKAMERLSKMINTYEELLHKNWDIATEEQKARADKIKAETKRLQNMESNDDMQEVIYRGIPSTMIAPAFSKLIFDIENREHLEYVLPGGRGSTKSSFASEEVIDLIMKNDKMHACVLRQVGDTLKNSVYNQVKWAIDALGLTDEFKCLTSPLEITRKSTGQKIFFRGADDPDKIKSIKVPFGYIGIAWFEELDQFKGPEAVRKIEQSIIRGGDEAYIFKSFNPPKSANNWANKYIKLPKENRLVVPSTYLDVPKSWLGKPFLDEAEFLKKVNPDAYENEYKGVANGNGGNVFDNVEIREITDQEIKEFDRIYNGVDWGWYPDPWAFNRMHYDAARRTLYIFDEAHANKKSNRETADILIKEHNIKPNDKIVCDSAEHKSTSDYKSYGLFARDAIKGPGSVEYSMKWLASLSKIVIDRVRAPKTSDEFLDYEYERDKNGEVISGYPDKDNHHIDAIRYAMEEVWRRKGK